MARKVRPFTRKQRARLAKLNRIAAAAERRAVRDEAKAYTQTLDIFKRCDPDRTEALADGRDYDA